MATTEVLSPRVFGTEIEFGFVPMNGASDGLRFENHLPKGLSFSYLGSTSSRNIFLANGARYYMDIGSHPEYATPECTSIDDELIPSEFAGEEIVFSSFQRAHQAWQEHTGNKRSALDFNKRVVDDFGNFWGAHESYQIPRALDPTSDSLLIIQAAQLLTRGIFSGAGRFDGNRWHVAQKLAAVRELATNSATATSGGRGLINTRDEPHADPSKWRRLHIIFGDPNMSPWALRMKVGTTSLALMLPEFGIPVDDIALDNPERDAAYCAADVDLTYKLQLSNGRTATMLDLQNRLREKVHQLKDRVELSEEQLDIIKEWDEGCDDIAKDPYLLDDRADWIKKLSIVRDLQENGKLPTEKAGKKQRSIDMSYGNLDPKKGIGLKLRAQGAFRNMPKRAAIERAITDAPITTRAFLRGLIIKLSKKNKMDIAATGWDSFKHNGRTYKVNNPTTVEHSVVSKLAKVGA